MSMYTRCPHCDTHFRVAREQLQASSGQVRCGRCQKVFDAFATLSAQLPPSVAGPVASRVPPSLPAADSLVVTPLPETIETPPSPLYEPAAPEESHGGPPREQEILTLPDDLFGPGAPRLRHGPRWPWALASIAALLALLAQGLYFFATDMAVRLPEFRPQLTEACLWLRCAVALPRLPEQLLIEASDLQVLDATKPREVLLTATIRNRAALTQELPLIELTLTDASNQANARKVFYPADYLDKTQDPTQGIPSNQEIPIKLYLDTGDIKPAGYRLYLFFA
jgi:predicted Zn finger-like uncharacterized protein